MFMEWKCLWSGTQLWGSRLFLHALRTWHSVILPLPAQKRTPVCSALADASRGKEGGSPGTEGSVDLGKCLDERRWAWGLCRSVCPAPQAQPLAPFLLAQQAVALPPLQQPCWEQGTRASGLCFTRLALRGGKGAVCDASSLPGQKH